MAQRYKIGEAIGVYFPDAPEFFLVRGHVDEPTFARECEAEGFERADLGPARHRYARVGFASESLRMDGCNGEFYFSDAPGRGWWSVTYADRAEG